MGPHYYKTKNFTGLHINEWTVSRFTTERVSWETLTRKHDAPEDTVSIHCKLALWKLLCYQRNKVGPNTQHVKLLHHNIYSYVFLFTYAHPENITLHWKPCKENLTSQKESHKYRWRGERMSTKLKKSMAERLIFTTAILPSTKEIARLRQTKNSNAETNTTLGSAGTGLTELNSAKFITMTATENKNNLVYSHAVKPNPCAFLTMSN